MEKSRYHRKIFGWHFCTDAPDRFLARYLRAWVRLRLRRTKKGHDFLHVGFCINACQEKSSQFFTGVRVGLFNAEWYIGSWHPLNHYNVAPWEPIADG